MNSSLPLALPVDLWIPQGCGSDTEAGCADWTGRGAGLRLVPARTVRADPELAAAAGDTGQGSLLADAAGAARLGSPPDRGGVVKRFARSNPMQLDWTKCISLVIARKTAAAFLSLF